MVCLELHTLVAIVGTKGLRTLNPIILQKENPHP